MPRPLVLVAAAASSVAAISGFLRMEGFACVNATSGAEVVAALESQPVTAIVIDAGLTDPPAAGIIRRLRANPTGAAVAVLVLAADDAAARAALEAGASDVLRRPFALAVVAARLRDLVPGASPPQG